MPELERDTARMRQALMAIERRASDALLKNGSKSDARQTIAAIHRLASEARDPAKAAAR